MAASPGIPGAVVRTLDVDGTSVQWEERGEGPPIVFVHGIPTLRHSGGK